MPSGGSSRAEHNDIADRLLELNARDVNALQAKSIDLYQGGTA